MKWILAILAATPALAATCEELKSLKLPDTTIVVATMIDEGLDLPAHCQVSASGAVPQPPTTTSFPLKTPAAAASRALGPVTGTASQAEPFHFQVSPSGAFA